MATATKKAPAKKAGTAVATKAANAVALPSNAQELMAQAVADLKNKLAVPAGDGIAVGQDKTFRFPGSDDKLTSFNAIIVDFVSFNAYYEGQYNKDDIVPPNCFALGTVPNEQLMPSENSPDPQSEGGNCRTCWANAFKSADNGKGKACKQSVKLALLCDDGELHPMKISSTGLKAFGAYTRSVVETFGVAPFAVMTTFSFDPDSDYPSVRCTDPVQLDEAQIALVFTKREEALQMLQAEPDVSEFEEKVVKLRNAPKGKARGAASTAPTSRRRA